MSEKEKQIIKTLADKLPAMSSKKEELEKDGSEKKVG